MPAAGWGEKDSTVTNSEQRKSRQRGVLFTPSDPMSLFANADCPHLIAAQWPSEGCRFVAQGEFFLCGSKARMVLMVAPVNLSQNRP